MFEVKVASLYQDHQIYNRNKKRGCTDSKELQKSNLNKLFFFGLWISRLRNIEIGQRQYIILVKTDRYPPPNKIRRKL